MSRRMVIGFAVLGALVVVLGISLAWVGTNFDRERIEREDLQSTVDALEIDVDQLSGERDQLQQQTQEQTKTIEQLKADLERARNEAKAASPAAAGSPATP